MGVTEEFRLGAAMAGGRPKGGERHHLDFYPTPAAPVTALLAVEAEHMKGLRLWEPACGDGAIARLLVDAGFDVLATDVLFRGYGVGGRDFLRSEDCDGRGIFTNPPFDQADEFLRHAWLTLRVPYLAMLLKSTYWHAAKRVPLFELCPPAAVYALTWRVDFTGDGRSTMDVSWFVWDRRRLGPAIYRLLSRLDVSGQQSLLSGVVS